MAEARLRPALREDFAQVRSLIRASNLPDEGLADQFPAAYVVAEERGRVLGVAGLEVWGEAGLLRSVAVDPGSQGEGLGRMMVKELLRRAQELKLIGVYLLTTSASEFFVRLGFEVIARESAPPEMKVSPEFAGICPASALCLVKMFR